MLAKIFSNRGAILFSALLLVAAGCTPAGPRALLKGKKLLDRGDYAAAAAELKNATDLMQTNAQAWNYYGVALQLAGRPEESAMAYQSALKYDRDLVEAHFNMGSLALEQGRADIARSEFTAYTLRRANDPQGWLKLGSAQLKLNDITGAERSFSTVYHLDANNAAALNGLGLARIKSGLPRDAEKFFAAAVKVRPDFAPALLNLGVVNQQYLHDNKAALEHFKHYLTLTPRPANADEVSGIISSLEAQEPRPVVLAAVEKPAPQPVAAEPKPVVQPKVSNAATQRAVAISKPAPVTVKNPAPTPTPIKPTPVQTVQVQPSPQIVTAPPPAQINPPVAEKPAVETEPVAAPSSEDQPKPSFWGKLFNGSPDAAPDTKYRGQGLTALPAIGADPSPKPVVIPAAKPLPIVEPVPTFPRYTYISPRKPAAGDRATAAGAFTRARLFEQEEKWPEALQEYKQSAVLDPSWFEAQYNAGVLAHRLRDYGSALPRYELALAIQKDSADARYNFALALKAAGYATDAAEQLKIILAPNDREVRAHLALANIYAQALRDKEQARKHYQRVLELDPANPQAPDIRYWISSNSN
jgi:tetratricopeptide (TPR) repeat protein